MSGLAWRGVVGVLCALWASNFAAAKIILAEPGVDSSLYAGMTYYKWVYFTVNHYVQAHMYHPFALSRHSDALFCGSVGFGAICHSYNTEIRY